MKKIVALSVLTILLILKSNLIFAQSDSLGRYSFLHWRFGLSSFKEINIGFNPLPHVQKHFFIGIGYRNSAYISSSCFLEIHQIRSRLHGPIFSVGYDGVTGLSAEKSGFSFQIFFKKLKADTMEYLETPCFLGEVHDDADYRVYWHEANVIGAKGYFETVTKEKWITLYFGLGCDFQFLTKHFIEGGYSGHSWPDNDIEKVLYVIPRFDFGVRLSALTKPRESGN